MNQRFTRRPTREQLKAGLALFALAKPLADDARKARQAHAIEAGATNNRPDDCDTGRGSAAGTQRDCSGAEGARGSIREFSCGDEKPQSSGGFTTAVTTTGGA